MLTRFLVSITAFLTATFATVLIGHLFSVPFLQFHFSSHFTSEGFTMEMGSLIPILIGLVASFAAEKWFTHRNSYV